MECRLCLSSAPAESLVSIHDDPHPPHLAQRIWTCCHLRIRKGDELPDMICRSCVNNLELLDRFRSACLRSDKMSRLRSDESLTVKPEEVLLEDLKWEDETGACFPPIISSSPDDDQIHGGKVSSDDVRSEMKDTINISADELPLRKASDEMCSTRSELDHKINFQDKSFFPKHNLLIQKTSDTKKKRHKCDVCLKTFTQRSSLSRHLKYHTGENLFKCDVCSKSFISKSSLDVHMSIHTGIRPYKCDICFKSFTSKCHLCVHMSIHSGVKPHTCDVCLKSFTRISSLSRHLKSHTGDTPFKCDVCLKSFTRKENLGLHMTVHTRYIHTCDICSKTFTMKYNLFTHMMVHQSIYTNVTLVQNLTSADT
ncbi:uncharacterized protein LOC143913377 [Arctopsyche grandis]|uniref:uncharacterized protein LOC143913377 n=1 Tax=Arctopsyche grandis TaxID=121162 RepID=UPI00406D65B6